MLAIVDARAPGEAIQKLRTIADELLLFESDGITYESVSGHPDIFIYQDGSNLVAAPNSPDSLLNFLERNSLSFQFGRSFVGQTLETTAGYNCVVTEDFLIHRSGFTDKLVLDFSKQKKFIDIPQAYTRCSMCHIGNNTFITSDMGIHKVLLKHELESFYFDPSEIRIKIHRNGFLGGTCGVYVNIVYFLGNILLHEDGKVLEKFITDKGLEIICLSNEKLYDGGGIFFI